MMLPLFHFFPAQLRNCGETLAAMDLAHQINICTFNTCRHTQMNFLLCTQANVWTCVNARPQTYALTAIAAVSKLKLTASVSSHISNRDGCIVKPCKCFCIHTQTDTPQTWNHAAYTLQSVTILGLHSPNRHYTVLNRRLWLAKSATSV